MRLALNLATRNRPQLLLSTVMQTLGNIRDPYTVLMVSADADDEATIGVLRTLGQLDVSPDRLQVSVQAREDTIAGKWNRVLREIPDADVYMPMCDDGPAVTRGFDEKILQAASLFPDGIGCVYNHLENASFPGIQAVTRGLVDLMGGVIYVEHFPYWFVDHWLDDVVRLIDRIAFADVRLDCASNRPPTMEMREPGFWATFFDACHLRRRHLAQAIVDSRGFVASDREKRRINGLHPLIEFRSKWINDMVRANQQLAAYAAQHAPDDRYLRVKNAAVALLRDEILPELEEDERDAA